MSDHAKSPDFAHRPATPGNHTLRLPTGYRIKAIELGLAKPKLAQAKSSPEAGALDRALDAVAGAPTRVPAAVDDPADEPPLPDGDIYDVEPGHLSGGLIDSLVTLRPTRREIRQLEADPDPNVANKYWTRYAVQPGDRRLGPIGDPASAAERTEVAAAQGTLFSERRALEESLRKGVEAWRAGTPPGPESLSLRLEVEGPSTRIEDRAERGFLHSLRSVALLPALGALADRLVLEGEANPVAGAHTAPERHLRFILRRPADPLSLDDVVVLPWSGARGTLSIDGLLGTALPLTLAVGKQTPGPHYKLAHVESWGMPRYLAEGAAPPSPPPEAEPGTPSPEAALASTRDLAARAAADEARWKGDRTRWIRGGTAVERQDDPDRAWKAEEGVHVWIQGTWRLRVTTAARLRLGWARLSEKDGVLVEESPGATTTWKTTSRQVEASATGLDTWTDRWSLPEGATGPLREERVVRKVVYTDGRVEEREDELLWLRASTGSEEVALTRERWRCGPRSWESVVEHRSSKGGQLPRFEEKVGFKVRETTREGGVEVERRDVVEEVTDSGEAPWSDRAGQSWTSHMTRVQVRRVTASGASGTSTTRSERTTTQQFVRYTRRSGPAFVEAPEAEATHVEYDVTDGGGGPTFTIHRPFDGGGPVGPEGSPVAEPFPPAGIPPEPLDGDAAPPAALMFRARHDPRHDPALKDGVRPSVQVLTSSFVGVIENGAGDRVGLIRGAARGAAEDPNDSTLRLDSFRVERARSDDVGGFTISGAPLSAVVRGQRVASLWEPLRLRASDVASVTCDPAARTLRLAPSAGPVDVDVELEQSSGSFVVTLCRAKVKDTTVWTERRLKWFERAKVLRDEIADAVDRAGAARRARLGKPPEASPGEAEDPLAHAVAHPLAARDVFFANTDVLRGPLERALEKLEGKVKKKRDDVDELRKTRDEAAKAALEACDEAHTPEGIAALGPKVAARDEAEAALARARAELQELERGLNNPFEELDLLHPDVLTGPVTLRIPRRLARKLPVAVSPRLRIVVRPLDGTGPLAREDLPYLLDVVGFLRGAPEPAGVDVDVTTPAAAVGDMSADPSSRHGFGFRGLSQDDRGWTFPARGPDAGCAVWRGPITILDNVRRPEQGMELVRQLLSTVGARRRTQRVAEDEEDAQLGAKDALLAQADALEALARAHAAGPPGLAAALTAQARAARATAGRPEPKTRIERILAWVDDEVLARSAVCTMKEYRTGEGKDEVRFLSSGLPLSSHRTHHVDLVAAVYDRRLLTIGLVDPSRDSISGKADSTRDGRGGLLLDKYSAFLDRMAFLYWRMTSGNLFFSRDALLQELKEKAARGEAITEEERTQAHWFGRTFDTTTPAALAAFWKETFFDYLTSMVMRVQGADGPTSPVHSRFRASVRGPDRLGLRLLPAELARAFGALDIAPRDGRFVVDFVKATQERHAAERAEQERAAAKEERQRVEAEQKAAVEAQAHLRQAIADDQTRWLAFQGLQMVLFVLRRMTYRSAFGRSFFDPRNPLWRGLLNFLNFATDEWREGDAPATGSGNTRPAGAGKGGALPYDPKHPNKWRDAGYALFEQLPMTPEERKALDRPEYFEYRDALKEKGEAESDHLDAQIRLDRAHRTRDQAAQIKRELEVLDRQERHAPESRDLQQPGASEVRRKRHKELSEKLQFLEPVGKKPDPKSDPVAAAERDVAQTRERVAKAVGRRRVQRRAILQPAFEYDDVRNVARATLTVGAEVEADWRFMFVWWILQLTVRPFVSLSGTLTFGYEWRTEKGLREYLAEFVARNEQGAFLAARTAARSGPADALATLQYLVAQAPDAVTAMGLKKVLLVNNADAGWDQALHDLVLQALRRELPLNRALCVADRARLRDEYRGKVEPLRARQAEELSDAQDLQTKRVEADGSVTGGTKEVTPTPLTDEELDEVLELPRAGAPHLLEVAHADDLEAKLELFFAAERAGAPELRYLVVCHDAAAKLKDDAFLRRTRLLERWPRPLTGLRHLFLVRKDLDLLPDAGPEVLDLGDYVLQGKVVLTGGVELKLSPAGLGGAGSIPNSRGVSKTLEQILEACEVSVSGVIDMPLTLGADPKAGFDASLGLRVTLSANLAWLEFPFVVLDSKPVGIQLPLKGPVSCQAFAGETWFCGERLQGLTRDLTEFGPALDDFRARIFGPQKGPSSTPWWLDRGSA